jgi:hypothetical protein
VEAGRLLRDLVVGDGHRLGSVEDPAVIASRLGSAKAGARGGPQPRVVARIVAYLSRRR